MSPCRNLTISICEVVGNRSNCFIKSNNPLFDNLSDCLRSPVTAICEVVKPSELESAVMHVQQADKVIFVSPNAVEFGLKVLKTHAIHIAPPTEILAVGPGTANRLREQGLSVSGIPLDQFNSEGLLKMPQLIQVKGQKSGDISR